MSARETGEGRNLKKLTEKNKRGKIYEQAEMGKWEVRKEGEAKEKQTGNDRNSERRKEKMKDFPAN